MRSFLCVLLVLAPVALFAQTEEVGPEPYVSVPAPANTPTWQRGPSVLVDNGPLVTGVGTGAGGADESAVQNVTLGMTTLGFATQFASGNRMADDFTINAPESWQIDTCTFFAYQTGSPTTSTITAVTLQIWDGPPNGGGSVIWGDTVTNRMSSTAWSNIYRVAETTGGDSSRPIMANVVDVDTTLADGTYWFDWSTDGTLGSGPWAPPVTIVGNPSTGNGLQFFGGAWGDAADGGNGQQQGLPFVCEGTVMGLDADLEVTKEGVLAGYPNVEYTITVTNNGPSDATNVVVTDALPQELDYDSDDCGGSDIPPWTWNVGNLANGASATCTLYATANTNGTIINTAMATADQDDPTPGNDAASASVTLTNVLEIPTLGQWGLIALLLALGFVGVLRLRR